MEREDILKMEPGRELDALVAVKVFGLTEPWWENGEPIYPGLQSVVVPHFCTDISAAWEVVEKMLQSGWSHTINFIKDWRYPDGIQHCCFSKPQAHISTEDALCIDQKEKVFFHGHCETVPEAICKAALLAVITT